MKSLFSFFALLSLVLLGCSKNSSSNGTNVDPDIRGQWDSELAYSNDYFGLKVEVPAEWAVEKTKNQEMDDAGAAYLAGDDENLRASLKSAVEKTHTVFSAYRYPLGTPGKSNPNVTMLIENVGGLPGVKSGSDYLLAMEDTLKMSNADMNFTTKPAKVDVGGKEFWVRDLIMNVGQIKVNQSYYATYKEEHVFVYIVTTITEKDKEIVAEITDTIGAK